MAEGIVGGTVDMSDMQSCGACFSRFKDGDEIHTMYYRRTINRRNPSLVAFCKHDCPNCNGQHSMTSLGVAREIKYTATGNPNPNLASSPEPNFEGLEGISARSPSSTLMVKVIHIALREKEDQRAKWSLEHDKMHPYTEWVLLFLGRIWKMGEFAIHPHLSLRTRNRLFVETVISLTAMGLNALEALMENDKDAGR